ncbi:biotin-dependent carboxyltransferase family protein [Peribacillus saganii]|uniref:Biotin-dependent carboxyltransferase family protein n=2 Tax=Peribacillus saganii TaxID=2303992 RepID=A0A372LQF9_9BACI|nr:biotin-dependent carboxyltransferase family protein [Peribacillus saganii]
MEFLEIIKPGLLTTIQDLGRKDYQIYGISTCGAMDPFSSRIANILVGNNEVEAVLEVTLVGPKIKFIHDGLIAITGADLSSRLNGETIPLWKSIKVSKGDILDFGPIRYGCRSYIAVAGGIDVPQIMGSKSTFIRGGYGGLDGRKLQKGDTISIDGSKLNTSLITSRKLPPSYILNFEEDRKVRVILGPQLEAFTKDAIEDLFLTPYKISIDSDRMGYRLEGVPLTHVMGADILSDFITAGSIQVPGSGQPIVLMSDCQVTGGYTKIGVVIGVDLPYLAQKKPGDYVRFEKIGIAEAQRLWKKQEQILSIMNKVNYTQV